MIYECCKPREFKCPYCCVEGRTKTALYQHIEVYHPGRAKRANKTTKKNHVNERLHK